MRLTASLVIMLALPSSIESLPFFWNPDGVEQTTCVGGKWTLFENGERSNGVETVALDDLHLKSQSELATWAAAHLGIDDCSDCTLYDETAKQIESCREFGDDKSIEAWVVLPDRWFVFPPSHIGRTVTVPRISPKGSSQPVIVETISMSPRVFHLHNFVTLEEADSLIRHSEGNDDPVFGLQPSTTGAEHEVQLNSQRTSENAFDVGSPAAKAVKRRSMDLLGMHPYDERMTDGLQVLRYNVSKAYHTHMDYFDDNGGGHDYDSSNQGSNRFATILFYLSDVDGGGETVFPNGRAVEDGVVDEIDGVTYREPITGKPEGDGGLFPANSWQSRMIGKCQTKLAVRPAKAHAILFYSQHPDGRADKNSVHGGCPVLNGTKWAANLWIWNKVRLGYPDAPRKSGALPFDGSKGFSRDRLKKNQAKNKNPPAENPNPTNRNAVFRNNHPNQNLLGAKLYWEDTYFADLPPGKEMSVNTFVGHQWYLKDDGANGRVIRQWVVGEEPGLQVFELEEFTSEASAPGIVER